MQLLASDYDGTLKQYSDKEKELTVEKRDKEAIDEFRERGNLFGIVTGRSKGMIDLELKKYGIRNCSMFVKSAMRLPRSWRMS